MAAGDRYVPLNFAEVKALLEGDMGFEQKQPKGTRELCWQRQVVVKGVPVPYVVRVYSTLEPTGECRELGADAIRVVLVDIEDGDGDDFERVLTVEKRVFRTKSAMDNLRTRARELYGYVLNAAHRCPCCGRLMQVRKSTGKRNVNRHVKVRMEPPKEFFACTGFNHNKACKHTSNAVPETAYLKNAA